MKSGFIPFGSEGYFNEAPDRPHAGLKTVHVIDDMSERLHFIAVVLEQAGYETELHSSLADFAREFQEHNTAAILIDIRLEEEDATDVLDYLRRAGSAAPIFLISGDTAALNNTRRYAEEIGLSIVDTIAKPFTGRQVLDRLERKSTALRAVFDQIDVAQAVREGWIYPVLQPKLDIASGRIRSAELLSRMTHPDFGVVPPQRFIPHMSSEQNQTLFMNNVAYAHRHFGFDERRGNDFSISINVDATNLGNVRSKVKDIEKNADNSFSEFDF